ncbi:MAG: hypothetical protein ABIR52_01015 [Casimicrobiaceae bacterium]
MNQIISPLAGEPAPVSILVDVQKLLAAYADLKPDSGVPAQRVALGMPAVSHAILVYNRTWRRIP